MPKNDGVPVTRLQTQVAKLAPHGRELWDAIETGWKLDAATAVLVLQVCRLTDKLDRLEAALKSKNTWLRIAEESELDDGRVRITVEVDSVLAESRQQAMALNAVLHKLGVGKLEDAIPKGSKFADMLKEIQGL